MKYAVAICFALVSGLSGCQDQGAVLSEPYEAQFVVEGGYQANYARTLRTMQVCLGSGAIFSTTGATLRVDGQLFSDLKYGEIIYMVESFNQAILGMVRIEAKGSGSMISVKAPYGVESGRNQLRKKLVYWAKGGRKCNRSTV